MAPLDPSTSLDPQLERAELKALLNLMLLPQTGDITMRRLLETWGSPTRALAERASEIGEPAVSSLRSKRQRDRVAASLRTIEQLGIKVLVQTHPAYPERLLHLHDPPAALFLIGDIDLLNEECLAIVGARDATPYGERVTADIAGDLARAGLVICSGMAIGIDSAAHTAALDVGGGTIAVLGCGADVVYPAENDALYRRIADHGLIVSEFIPGDHATKGNFPRRNRIIAALSCGVLVVEASLKSGSLITVNHALDIGRDVFAVPGPLGFQQSEGTNKLIQDGARLIASSSDILRELGIPEPARVERRAHPIAPPANISTELRNVWNALADAPRHVDEIARTCTLPTSVALTSLLELELAGYAQQCAGMQYVRAST